LRRLLRSSGSIIVGIDHIVLTVSDLERTIAFYTGLLGMGSFASPAGRRR
jgi:hypothetical protein